MPDFVTLSCPNCGGKLKVTSDIDRFACSHCGVEHIVKRGEGIISLSPVMDAIARVQSSVDVIAEDVRARKEYEKRAQEKEVISNKLSQLKKEADILQHAFDNISYKTNGYWKRYFWGGVLGLVASVCILFSLTILSVSGKNGDAQYIVTVCGGIGVSCGALTLFLFSTARNVTKQRKQLSNDLTNKSDEVEKQQELLDKLYN